MSKKNAPQTKLKCLNERLCKNQKHIFVKFWPSCNGVGKIKKNVSFGVGLKS